MSDALSLHFFKTNKIYFMEEDEVIVGQSEECSLQLFKSHFDHSVETISRRHFKISKAKDGFVLIDLLSSNGTKINTHSVIPNVEYLLRHGDIIALAKNKKLKLRVAITNMSAKSDGDSDNKRTKIASEATVRQPEPALEPAKLTLYFEEKRERFVVDGHPIPITHFTELEHQLLLYLYNNAERLCLYSEITEKVWHGWVSSNNIISSAVGRIRRKLDTLSPGAGKRYIKTKASFGYMLTLQNTD